MIRKFIKTVSDCFEDRMRSILGRITTDGRIIIILLMLFLFGGISIYMSVSSIYNMGKKSGEQMQIEHIERLNLQSKQKSDSTNLNNNFNYE